MSDDLALVSMGEKDEIEDFFFFLIPSIPWSLKDTWSFLLFQIIVVWLRYFTLGVKLS